MLENYPQTAQGEAKLATEQDLEKDVNGITNPNLHRRIDNQDTPKEDKEIESDTYIVSVNAVNSFRTTKHTVHDEESDESEIP